MDGEFGVEADCDAVDFAAGGVHLEAGVGFVALDFEGAEAIDAGATGIESEGEIWDSATAMAAGAARARKLSEASPS